jgi:hypothetical protein
VESAVDFGGYLSWRDFSPLFGPGNDVFHLKIHRAVVAVVFFSVWDSTIIFCRVVCGYNSAGI